MKKLACLLMVLALAGSASAWVNTDGLLLDYQFEGDATNGQGSLGTNGDGTEVGFSTADHYTGGGKWGSAEAFNLLDTAQNSSYDDTILVNGVSDTIKDRTYSLWFKRPDDTSTSYTYLMWGNLRLNIETNSMGDDAVGIFGNPTVYVSGHASLLASNTWIHMVATFDDNGNGSVDPSFYVNGVEMTSGDTDQPDDSGQTIRLGWGKSNSGWLIDDFRVYNFHADSTRVGEIGATALVPEPATIALLGLGGLALIRRKR